MKTETLSISHYRDTQELSYSTFPVTADGLREARELLATKTANRHRYAISPWQLEDPYDGQLDEAYRLLEAGDADGLAKLLRESCPQV